MVSNNIEQNKNYSAIIITAFFVVVLVAFLFSSPVYADHINDIDFSSQPIPRVVELSAIDIRAGGFVFSKNRGGGNNYIASLEADSYCVVCTPNYSRFYPVVFSTSYITGQSVAITQDSDSVYFMNSSGSVSYDGITYYYSSLTNNVISVDSSSITVPYFYGSFEDNIGAVISLLSSTGGGGSSSSSVVPLSTSYLTYDTGSYIRASMPDVSGVAYWSDDSGQTLHLTVASIDPNCFITRSTDSASSPVTLYRSLDPENCYYATVSAVSQDFLSIGYFSSQNDAVEAIYEYLVDNGGTPVAYSAHSLTYDLPAGNAIFLDVTGVVGSFSLDTTSSTSVSVSEFNSNDNRAIGYVDDLPESFSIPYPGLSDVVWDASGSPNLLGRYQHFSSSYGYAQGNHKYLVIVNPTYDNLSVQNGTLQSDNPAATNGYLTINARCNNFYIVALSASVSLEDGNFVLDGESSGKRYNGIFDDSTGQPVITDSETGQPSSPVVGGQNNIGGDTSEERFASFVDWLKNTIKGIGDALNVGKNAIVNLVSYASGFFSVIGQLYSWLPPPVYSVLVSAIVLAITIGIIKVFI